MWDVELGSCLRVLLGHEQYISCVRFNSKRIISTDGNGIMKVWDLNAALDRNKPLSELCLVNIRLEEESKRERRVTCLKFDEYQIVCGSYERIMVLDFLNYSPSEHELETQRSISCMLPLTAQSVHSKSKHFSICLFFSFFDYSAAKNY